MWKMTVRRKPLLVAAAVLPILGGAGAAAVADPVTGQNHPGDVTAVEGQYVPSTVHVEQGHTFTFGNYDLRAGIPGHSVVEVVPGCTAPPYTGNNAGNGTCTYPRFTSSLVDHGHVHRVTGVKSLAPGRYKFTCQVHSWMHGTLVVSPSSGLP
jgi:plastocyanin